MEASVRHTVETARDLKLIRLSMDDIQHSTEPFQQFCSRILENETLYPGIDLWMKNRVIPGLRSSERTAFICYENETPVATAIVKLGKATKFCHLRIDEQYQDQHLGEILFSLMALEAAQLAKEIHFTLPESLWEDRRGFFSSFGFNDVVKSDYKYRRSERELTCSAPFTMVWGSVLAKLPKLSSHLLPEASGSEKALIMSIKPHLASLILNGTKKVEIRRRFHQRWMGHRVSLYASSPVQSIVGEATIASVQVADPLSVWDEFGPLIGCTREEYVAYVESAKEVFAIQLDDVVPYEKKAPLSQVNNLLNCALKPPQSYFSANIDSKWFQAAFLANLLQDKTESRPS